MKTRTLLVLTMVLAAGSSALAGQWLTPDWAGRAPKFAPVPLYWFQVVRSPVIYRTVVDVPANADRATALLRTSGYAYVCVDGQQVFGFAAEGDNAEKPAIAGDPATVHELDLTTALTPGKHVLTVSAPAGNAEQGGFVLDGGIYKADKRLAALVSNDQWTVTMFFPTAIVEDSPIMTLAYDGKAVEGVCSAAATVKAAGDAWVADEDALAAAYYNGLVARFGADLDDLIWQLGLLANKGIYIVNDTEYGWGGSLRPQVVGFATAAKEQLDKTPSLSARLRTLKGAAVKTASQLKRALADVQKLQADIAALAAATQRISEQAAAADEEVAMALASKIVPIDSTVAPAAQQLRGAIEDKISHPLNVLNESRYDRLGWMANPDFTDSDVGNWGIRISPVTGPTNLRFNFRWLFNTDPNNSGIREQRQTIGYNIEGQWPRIDAQQSWTNNDSFKNYKGIAWYRQTVFVPTEWAGNAVVFDFSSSDAPRVWVNDQEVTDLAKVDKNRYSYAVPSSSIRYGSDNVVAIRVKAEGNSRGLRGVSTFSCPSLDGERGKDTPIVHVLATPLSPCAILTPTTNEIQINHAGKIKLLLPGGKQTESYSAAADGKLKANWVVLWMLADRAKGVERPILLVFRHNPVSIKCEMGVTTVKLRSAGEQVVAVRPFAKADPKTIKPGRAFDKLVEMWSRAAMAVPINYMSLTKVLKEGEPWENASIDNVPAGPVLGQMVVYDYLMASDDWGTEPLKLAPVPALCSMAIDTKFRNLKIDNADAIEVLHDGGLAAQYRAIQNADRISYSYDIEPWPRLVGFTSWMFGGTDAGVPGNKREMELMAAIGANSYRPQHNWANQLPPEWFRDGDKTRVRIIADYCNAAGLTYTNNIDERLGGSEQRVMNQYDAFIELVCRHYENIARQIGDRPFWAVSYDLINEGAHHKAVNYNPAMKKLTARVRAIDKRHLCYIEPCESWGAIQKLQVIVPTGDPLTMYSFHDYNFRLNKPTDRWPTQKRDMRNMAQAWWPVYEFAVKYGVGMHCGEFGGFHQTTNDNLAQKVLMNDFFKLFDQLGMHHHYYAGRGAFARQADGSQRPSNVVHVYREYFRRADFNMYYKVWPEAPKPPTVK